MRVWKTNRNNAAMLTTNKRSSQRIYWQHIRKNRRKNCSTSSMIYNQSKNRFSKHSLRNSTEQNSWISEWKSSQHSTIKRICKKCKTHSTRVKAMHQRGILNSKTNSKLSSPRMKPPSYNSSRQKPTRTTCNLHLPPKLTLQVSWIFSQQK